MKAEQIKPLGANIVVKPVEPEQTTESGIVLPDSAREETPQVGTVLAVGDSKSINPAITKGAQVIFKQYAGNKIKINDDEELIILNAMEDVLAVVEE